MQGYGLLSVKTMILGTTSPFDDGMLNQTQFRDPGVFATCSVHGAGLEQGKHAFRAFRALKSDKRETFSK
jgi:hypothetical protein